MRQVWFTTSGWLRSPAVLVGDPTTRPIVMPTMVAIAEREDGSILLVDAGWGARACENPDSLGLLGKRMFGQYLQPGDDIATKMRRAGLDPERVTTIVLTHLHVDHVGGVHDFPNAEVITTHDEMSEALRRTWDPGYKRELIEDIRRLRLVYLEPNPRLGFEQTFELSEDVVLLGTPGHTLGHVAVLLRQRDGRTWIHGGDVAYVYRELQRRSVSPLMRIEAHDMVRAKRSQEQLLACEKDSSHPRIVLSHDATHVSGLPILGGEPLQPPQQ